MRSHPMLQFIVKKFQKCRNSEFLLFILKGKIQRCQSHNREKSTKKPRKIFWKQAMTFEGSNEDIEHKLKTMELLGVRNRPVKLMMKQMEK